MSRSGDFEIPQSNCHSSPNDSDSDQTSVSSPSFRKRKRDPSIQGEDSSAGTPETADDQSQGQRLARTSQKRRPLQRIEAITLPPLVHPRSFYPELNESKQVFVERDVLKEALVSERPIYSKKRH